MYKHILIPTDGSKLAREAGEAAVKLAGSLGARVTAFFAAPPATPVIFKALLPVGYATPQEHEAMTRKAADSYLMADAKAGSGALVQSLRGSVRGRRGGTPLPK